MKKSITLAVEDQLELQRIMAELSRLNQLHALAENTLKTVAECYMFVWQQQAKLYRKHGIPVDHLGTPKQPHIQGGEKIEWDDESTPQEGS